MEGRHYDEKEGEALQETGHGCARVHSGIIRETRLECATDFFSEISESSTKG